MTTAVARAEAEAGAAADPAGEPTGFRRDDSRRTLLACAIRRACHHKESELQKTPQEKPQAQAGGPVSSGMLRLWRRKPRASPAARRLETHLSELPQFLGERDREVVRRTDGSGCACSPE